LERLTAFLHRRRTQPDEAAVPEEMGRHLADTLETICLRQDSLEAVLTAPHAWRETADRGQSIDEREPSDALEWQSAVLARLTGIESALAAVSQKLDEGRIGEIASEESLALADTVMQDDGPSLPLPVDSAASQDEWMSAMLGASLSENPQIGDALGRLRTQVLAGSLSELSLLGQLLVFRCASADRKPTTLKDMGEALYRCFPKRDAANEPFELALAEWVGRHCQEGGLPNSIELVHPGDRFDATRHAPVERGGVEVDEVLGWIVLRDGGKVFAKAAVSTR
jgi:hypothetical protein